ncbi:hypothetical protein JDV02_002810 [Purpureocillium takamizusanense]|uniref:Uncharacterized protein n=1 Tax=Purpureocillium takamizusanense TaxID=2060973 RepID=A0A9Q8Q9F0_9HYPO|nr:uncharacterized protein JDV02_002810 [Purpureocillium takamizusanense]UNI16374.1 hypothetical protein JDV02_002810 [Purpureocillium takamizusanense]
MKLEDRDAIKMAATTTTEEQTQRSKGKLSAYEPPHIHSESRHARKMSQTFAAHGTYPVAHWRQHDQIRGDSPPCDQPELGGSAPKPFNSIHVMGQKPFDHSNANMWMGNEGGHPNQSGLSQHKSVSVAESGPLRDAMNNPFEQKLEIAQFAQMADFGSSEPELIPGTNPPAYAYPHSTSYIGDAFHDRFREVVSMFRENTEKHHQLAPFVQNIDYTLRMCGPSYTAAHPSILVFCRKQEFKCLRSLLASRELALQYLRRKPGKTNDFLGWFRKPTLECMGTPLFDLYFWRTTRPRTLLGQHNARIQFNHGLKSWSVPEIPYTYSLCGAVVKPFANIGSSTFGCALLVNSELYGLTTRHNVSITQGVLPGRRVAEVDLGPIAENESTPVSNLLHPDASTAASGHCEFVVDDIEYESLSDDEGEEDIVLPVVLPEASPDELSPDGLDVLLIPHQDELGPTSKYDLDWALFKVDGLVGLEHVNQRLVNHTRVPGRGVIRHYARACPTRDTSVFLVTRGAEPLQATLRPGISIIGGINGNKVSPVWTVGPVKGQGLGPGDSGSIVVDATDDSIYGLIIGTNPMDEVYISPFVEIMNQVQHCFPHASISLPEPEPSSIAHLNNTSPFYSSLLMPDAGLPYPQSSSYLNWTDYTSGHDPPNLVQRFTAHQLPPAHLFTARGL